MNQPLMHTIHSEGKCLYCNETFSKQGINRHLQKHLVEKTKDNKPGKSFLIKVEHHPRYGNAPYFLSLWVDGEGTIGDIDLYLRKIWLECCGHLSSFTDPKARTQKKGMWDFFEAEALLEKGKVREYEKMMEEIKGEVPQSRKVKIALGKGLKLDYEYDFGSTTYLQLTVVDEYAGKADTKIVLLSRNEPPQIPCALCGKEPAVLVCSVCFEDNLFCKKCAPKHAKGCPDFDDYAAMPLVNSPRAGVCAYEGGIIDTERDSVYRQK